MPRARRLRKFTNVAPHLARIARTITARDGFRSNFERDVAVWRAVRNEAVKLARLHIQKSKRLRDAAELTLTQRAILEWHLSFPPGTVKRVLSINSRNGVN